MRMLHIERDREPFSVLIMKTHTWRINGTLQQYSYCAELRTAYDAMPIGKELKYLGVGMMFGKVYYFWRKLTERDRKPWLAFTSSKINKRCKRE